MIAWHGDQEACRKTTPGERTIERGVVAASVMSDREVTPSKRVTEE